MSDKSLRHRGQFVSRYGLQKIATASDAGYDLIIADRYGRPVFYLTEWYARRTRWGAESTTRAYLNMLLPYAGFLIEQGYAWNAEPEQVRHYVQDFLQGDDGVT